VHARRRPVGGVVLTKITLEDEYRAMAHPIASVGYLETDESLRQRITQRRFVVEPSINTELASMWRVQSSVLPPDVPKAL
jgi:hypothetical protein